MRETDLMKIKDIKTNFTAGEVSRQLLGRGDLRAYANGALTLHNLFIYPTGGVTRRAGLGFIDTLAGKGRLISFEFNTQQTYLIALSDMQIDIFLEGLKVVTLTGPWTEEQIKQLVWTQSADTLLLVHPDVPPKRLIRQSGGWVLEDWNFFTDNNVIEQPYYKFASSEATLSPSGVTGSIILTSSESVFESGHVNTRFRVKDKEVVIDTVNSPTVVTCTVIENFDDTDATIDWAEQAFSPVRGYPASVAFHQDRLVLGGSRDLPNRLWFSKSGDLYNFDLGEGLDDEAIEFAILSDQVNTIRAVFSGRHLQVFTSGAEWMVTGNPLTPETVQLNRQTRVGSVIDRYIPPVDVDGATLFVARNKQEIREFLYTDIEQAYQATDLALLSRHIITSPIDQDFDQRRRLLFIIREDGKFATLTVYRAEKVAAWTLHETQGAVQSVAVVGDVVYLLIDRNGIYTIEQFDDDLLLDSALTGEVPSPVANWSGLNHLEGQSVSIIADGIVQASQTVSSGVITLDDPASEVQIGLPYTHVIEPLPPSTIDGAGAGRSVRLVDVTFRVEETASLIVDVGRGLNPIALKQFGEDEILNSSPPLVSGDIRVNAFGWASDLTNPLWRIEQSQPLPFTLLSVSMELSVNG